MPTQASVRPLPQRLPHGGGPSRFLLLSFWYFSATSYHVTDHPCPEATQMVVGVVCTSDRLRTCARIRRSPPPGPCLRFGTPGWEGEAVAPAAQVPADPSRGSRVGPALPHPPCSRWHLEMSAHWLGSEMGRLGVEPSVLDAQNFWSMRQIKL